MPRLMRPNPFSAVRPKLWPKFAEQGYPRRFAWVLLSALMGIFFSGALLLPVLLMYQWEVDVPWVPHGDWRVGITAVHGLFGFLVVALSGALWLVHARAGWLRRTRHVSGAAILFLIGILLFSTPFLLYLSDATALTTAATVHAAAGILLLMMLLAHIWRRSRKK